MTLNQIDGEHFSAIAASSNSSFNTDGSQGGVGFAIVASCARPRLTQTLSLLKMNFALSHPLLWVKFSLSMSD